ncbi:aminoglycoside phosphotransferase family protein [Streptomyces sp. H10-C2]|uniref:aminoglycoside phosphotransferase family protein n=1 Tax=unclassified Streptomyces TaxID=2593676 RepID=UPI0024BABAAE|nr:MULTISPECIES: aminoglycoside phosphotransferase family protein [unclassified Streptomyces]MDJ0342626.1 aminoglycoside phosphotransferase family protein [Streptomyces sp. PH10-H1]MDJ0368520.1 aminoglycoside phosphotransferase family protein [Streptomyces sp. H10-C2]
MRSTKTTESWIEQELGPFGPAAIKPYSRTRFATDGSALLKVYVGIDPEGRRLREAATVARAALRGISVPAVLATGNDEIGSWTAFPVVDGTPCSVGTHNATEEYIGYVVAVSDRLHRPTAGANPGSGWAAWRAGSASSRQFLLDQFSPRCRWLPWWAVLREALQPIDSHLVVHLHGDLKPEHFLVDGELLHVVDWEASARGPAVLDYTDVVFHLVRDLLYEGVPPGRIPVDLVTRLPFSGPVLAWRLLLWLDRRRPQDIDLVTTRAVYRLAAEEQAASAYMSLAQTVALLRAAGVPR